MSNEPTIKQGEPPKPRMRWDWGKLAAPYKDENGKRICAFFEVDAEYAATARASAGQASREMFDGKRKFQVKTEDGVTRVWRVR